MNDRINHIPPRIWVMVGIAVGGCLAALISVGSLTRESSGESPLSAVAAHRSDVAEVMALLDPR